jgi:hypothetical protein
MAMKQTEEKCARLRELTGVTEEQAREALNANQEDLLDSLLWLEKQGIIEHSGVGCWSTAGSTQTEQRTEMVTTPPSQPPKTFTGWWKWLWSCLVNNRLEAYKKYDPTRQIQCPIGALLALVIIAWYVVAVILVVGIFMGWRYRLAGPELGKRNINEVVSWVDDLAEKARDELKNQVDRHGKK